MSWRQRQVVWAITNQRSKDRHRKSRTTTFRHSTMKRVVLRTASLIRQTAPAPRIQSPNIPVQRPLSRAYNRHSSFRRFHSQQAAETAKACPSCGAPLNLTEISCKTCNALSPLPENVNYLSLFGFPATSYDIDLRKLKSEYLKLMSKVHPDSVIHKSEVAPPRPPC